MGNLRPKDATQAATIADADDILIDGAAGVRGISYSSFKTDIAADIKADPATYGHATLDASQKLTPAQIPDGVASGITAQGGHDVATNTPTLADGTGTQGHEYIVTVAGTRDYGSGNITLAVGDALLHNGTVWEKIPQGVRQIVAGGTGQTTKQGVRDTFLLYSRDELDNRVLSLGRAAAIHLDGVTSGTRIYSQLTGYSVGTDDVTLRVTVRVPETNSSVMGLAALSSSNSTAVVANSIGVFLDAANLKLRLTGASASDYRAAAIGGFVTDHAGDVVDVAIKRTAGALTIYINGVDTEYTETTTGTAPADWQGSITSTYLLVGIFGSSGLFKGPIMGVQVFNYAIPESGDNSPLGLMENGIPFADQWGNPADLIAPGTLNGGFETLGGGGADVFADWLEGTSGTSSVNDETVDVVSGSHACRFDVDGSGSNAVVGQDILVVGKRYMAELTAKRGATNGTFLVEFGTFNRAETITPTTSYVAYTTAQIIADAIRFSLRRASGASANASFYFDDVTVRRLGAILDLHFGPGVGLHFPDRSSNRFWGQGVGGIGHTIPALSGERTITKKFLHSEISSTAGTTLGVELPPNCGPVEFEIDRTVAADAGITLDIGPSGTPAKHASAIPLDATGKVLTESLSKVSESSSANTSLYLKKSGATTTGEFIVRITYRIRGN